MWSRKKKILHFLCCVLSSIAKEDKLLNQLPIMCRKKSLGTSECNICRVQCAASLLRYWQHCRDRDGPLWLSREASEPLCLCSLWYLSCLIQSNGRNLNLSVLCSCTLSGEAGELMLLALLSSQLLTLSSSFCTEIILYPAQTNSALDMFIIIKSDNCSKKGNLVDIPK